MKWLSKPEALRPRRFEIKSDPNAGFYLYVFERDKCLRDHLQDSLENAIDSAFEDYGVPKDSWIKNSGNQ